jgi:hypothetical protein
MKGWCTAAAIAAAVAPVVTAAPCAGGATDLVQETTPALPPSASGAGGERSRRIAEVLRGRAEQHPSPAFPRDTSLTGEFA